MNSSLRTSASGMAAQQRMIDVIANNLANVNTTGFKRSRVSFEDVLYETLQGARVVNDQGAETVGPMQIGKGVRIGARPAPRTRRASPETHAAAARRRHRGRRLLPGPAPRRHHRLHARRQLHALRVSGALVTNDGYPVLPGITVPADATGVTIAPDGIVSVTAAGSHEPGRDRPPRAGALPEPERPARRSARTSTSRPPASGEPMTRARRRRTASAACSQGSLESSNVEIVQEMTDMIAAQRAYEINAKAIRPPRR